jgi:hypothetical protein
MSDGETGGHRRTTFSDEDRFRARAQEDDPGSSGDEGRGGPIRCG